MAVSQTATRMIIMGAASDTLTAGQQYIISKIRWYNPTTVDHKVDLTDGTNSLFKRNCGVAKVDIVEDFIPPLIVDKGTITLATLGSGEIHIQLV